MIFSIQLLRVISLALVLAFHSGAYFFEYGFLGVDIFFVISGFLMYYLYADKLNVSMSYMTFVKRRLQRLYPTMIIPVIFMVPLLHWFYFGDLLQKYYLSALFSLLGLGNAFYYFNSGYFDTVAEYNPFIHYWSLGAEIQFYVIFPPIFFLLRKYLKNLTFNLVAFFVLVLAADFAQKFSISGTFYLLPFRLFEFFLGILAARIKMGEFQVKAPEITKAMQSVLLLFIVIGIFVLVIFAAPILDDTIVIQCCVIGLTALSLVVTLDAQLPSAPIQNAINFIGSRSFTIYLLHQLPLAVLKSAGLLSLDRAIVCYAVVFLASVLIDHMLRHFDAGKVRSYARLVGVMVIPVALSGAVLHAMVPPETEFSKHLRSVQQDDERSLIARGDDCALHYLWPDFEEKFEQCAQKHDKVTLIAGDSHAVRLSNAAARSTGNFIVSLSYFGCRVDRAEGSCWEERFSDFFNRDTLKIDKLIVVQSFAYFLKDKRLNSVDEDRIWLTDVPYVFLEDTVEDFMVYFMKLTPNVVFVVPNYESKIEIGNALISDPSTFLIGRSRYLEFKDRFIAVAQVQGAQIVQQDPVLQEAFFLNGCMLLADTDHLSKCAADNLFSRVMSQN